MSQLTLSLLGTPTVKMDQRPVNLARRKVMALLLYVALADRPPSRDRLATMLWPESNQKGARAALRRELHALNQALGPGWLAITRDEIGLSAQADLAIDVLTFRRLLATAQHQEQPIECLVDAIELYQGDFLTGFTLSDCPTFDDWQFFEAAALRRDYANALAQLVQIMREQQQYDPAIDYARRWLALDSLEETVHRELMQLYALAGQQAAAVRQFDECTRILDEELGVPPDDATTALYEAIRARRFPTEQPPVAPSNTPPLVKVPDEPRQQATAVAAKRHNLSAPATSFVGRTEELNAITQLLLGQPECRLLTLVGPGGIGKTRLVLQLAQQLVDQLLVANAQGDFGDGIYFVPLETASSRAQIIAAVADAIDFTFQGNAEPFTQLLNYLRTKALLLILDNFEHLTDEAELLATMLQESPTLTIVVTSRAALTLQEEWLYAVNAFPLPQENMAAEEAAQNSAVKLFLERAHRADSSRMLRAGVLLPDLLAAVVRICNLVDGLPLGLELAATWVRSLSVHEIAAEISADLDFLATTKRGVADRHSSLRRVLEQSWQLLTPTEQAIFCRLAIFHNGFTRQAADRVAEASMLTVAALVRKSMISHQRDGRYTMHGLLHQFAAAQLHQDSAQADAVSEKHSRYYGMFLQSLEGKLTGAAHADALEQIGQELENIRSSWRWALGRVAHDPAHIPRLNHYVAAFFQFYDTRSRFQEGHAEFQLALDQLEPLAAARDVQLVLGRIYGRLGWFDFQTGQPAAAKVHLERSIALLSQLDAQDELPFALNYLGAVHRHLLEYGAAKRVLDQSRQISQTRQKRFDLTVALNILGQIAYEEQEYAQAQVYLAESSAIKQAIGDQRGAIFSLLYLGLVAQAQDDFAKAVRLFRESIQISEQHGDRRSVAIGLGNLAAVEALMGKIQNAQELYEQSLDVYTKIYNLLGIATIHIKLGDLARAQNNSAIALQRYTEALRLADELQLPPQALAALTDPARRWLAQNQAAGAES